MRRAEDRIFSASAMACSTLQSPLDRTEPAIKASSCQFGSFTEMVLSVLAMLADRHHQEA